MTKMIEPPKRKNPLSRTRQPMLPPRARSRRAHELTRAAAEGRFALQRCGDCGTFVYPAREACPACLSADLVLTDAPDGATILSLTTAEVPSDNYFRERAPWRLALVKLDCGPTAIAHLHRDAGPEGPVKMSLKLDKAGQAVFFAGPLEARPDMADDPQWREMTADPKFRRVLITDGRNPVCGPLVDALKKSGAAEIFVGIAEDWKPFADRAALEAIPGVTLVTLDLSSDQSVFELAADYGAKVDILINTADFVRPGGLLQPGALNPARGAMDVLVFGSMRLAQAFAPVMASRGADGVTSACAWVNLLSIYGQAANPSYAAYGAAHAAALALSYSLRAELANGGVRLMNVFSGPTDSEWFQALPQPKVAPKAIADAVVDGLKRGLEDLYVGDIARDLHERLLENPKAVERALAGPSS